MNQYRHHFAEELRGLGFSAPVRAEDDYEVRFSHRDGLHYAIHTDTGKITIAQVATSDLTGDAVRWATAWGTGRPALIGDASAVWEIPVDVDTPEYLVLAILNAHLQRIAEDRAAERLSRSLNRVFA
ncbi:hypothetical protein ACFWYW_47120 [Nonomuraea sp. NPDC059023]|uniref:hypothetical protein n=1 Tax=unclassified Nonomuraea TaxID=2593643 RepID=UPI0036AC30C9